MTNKETFDNNDNPVFLVSAANNFEAEILEGKLEAYGVPVMKRNKESGDYLQIYMGVSPFGIDLFVPSKLIERAREILETLPEVDEGDEEIVHEELEEEQEQQEELEKNKGRSRNWLFWLFFVFFVIPAILFLLFYIFNNGH